MIIIIITFYFQTCKQLLAKSSASRNGTQPDSGRYMLIGLNVQSVAARQSENENNNNKNCCLTLEGDFTQEVNRDAKQFERFFPLGDFRCFFF